MNFYRYLELSECISFLDIVFVWYKLNNAFFVFRFEDFQNLAYEGTRGVVDAHTVRLDGESRVRCTRVR